ncbi:MAG TPA: DUF2333 family protein, partial [Rhizobiales bacterium]|nr:DUF2333 family protein [Hyphomicrobiales bacterium]
LVFIPLFLVYGWFFWQTAWIRNYDVSYPDGFQFEKRMLSAGKPVSVEGGGDTTKTCGRSAIAVVTAALIDFNVNQNSWISSMPVYKAGLFGLDWDATPWFDNKASFQRGVHQAIRRTTVELTDTLGRIRGTSEADKGLQDARSAVQFDEFTWYINPFDNKRPFGPTTQTPTYYRSAIRHLNDFNDRLAKCRSTFDARADNLMTLLDRIAKDIGSTSAEIRDRAEKSNAGWFDTRADNLFMYAKGQLYGYYGVLRAARSDFRDVIKSRQVEDLWKNMEGQTRAALALDPFIISNGREDGWLMPTHLTTIGFYILRVRANLVEIRSVLDR